ncbi:DKNYY domain-containing protein [Formosa agariphila]|nr:DKNYY domain-containing protein [Formosa agariphila]
MQFITNHPYISAIIAIMLLNSIIKNITRSKRSPIGVLVLAITSFIGHACSPFSGAVDKTISDNYYYSKSGKEIRYSRMGNWFELGNSKVDADVASFEPLAREFAKDKDHVFYKDYIIDAEVDRSTFRAGEAIAYDTNHVYIPLEMVSYDIQDTLKTDDQLFIVAGADPETFERLDDWDWGKDAKNWFYNYRTIAVDYESFTPINTNFCKDINQVYIRTSSEILPCNIDAKTLKIINDRYVADARYIYDYVAWQNQKEVNTLHTFSYEDFERIDGTDSDYLYFDNQVIYDGILIEDATRATFKVLDSPTKAYAKNDQYVYYSGKKICGADVESFRLYDYDQYARDKNHVYCWGIKMEGVDIESFGPKEKTVGYIVIKTTPMQEAK